VAHLRIGRPWLGDEELRRWRRSHVEAAGTRASRAVDLHKHSWVLAQWHSAAPEALCAESGHPHHRAHEGRTRIGVGSGAKWSPM